MKKTIFSEDEKIYAFGKYPKAKYELIINKYKEYSFVTTCRSEEDCIQILQEIVDSKYTVSKKYYKITKKTNEGTKVLKTGSLPGLKL